MSAFKFTKTEKSFITYDVGNSAFTLFTTAVLPIFFASLASSAGVSKTISTAYWGYFGSISTLILALMNPILGSVADFKNNKRRVFFTFFAIGVLGNLLMCLNVNWFVLLIIFMFANIGYSGSLVFYDSMLTDVTTDDRMDRVSTAGYAWGYIGSCVPFIIGISLILTADKTGLGNANAVRVAMIITAVWWSIFTIPLLKNVKQRHYKEKSKHYVRSSFQQLGHTFGSIVKNKPMFMFIIAYFFYIDGVNTIISMATKYGDMLGLKSTGLILALLMTQFIAFPCAMLAGIIARRFNTRHMLMFCIAGYTGITIFAVFLHSLWQFWVLAALVGIFQGAIQALSRSYYAKLVPKEHSNEYFGFFDVFGKYAAILGPSIVAVFSQFGYPQVGIGCISILFIIGFVLFLFMPKNKADETIAEEIIEPAIV